MSKKFNKKQLKKINKSVSGGKIIKPQIEACLVASVYGVKTAAGTPDKTALQGTTKKAAAGTMVVTKKASK